MDVQPTEMLEDEHRAVEKMAGVMDRLAAKLEAGQTVKPETLRSMVEFVRVFVDKCHHGKVDRLPHIVVDLDVQVVDGTQVSGGRGGIPSPPGSQLGREAGEGQRAGQGIVGYRRPQHIAVLVPREREGGRGWLIQGAYAPAPWQSPLMAPGDPSPLGKPTWVAQPDRPTSYTPSTTSDWLALAKALNLTCRSSVISPVTGGAGGDRTGPEPMGLPAKALPAMIGDVASAQTTRAASSGERVPISFTSLLSCQGTGTGMLHQLPSI